MLLSTAVTVRRWIEEVAWAAALGRKIRGLRGLRQPNPWLTSALVHVLVLSVFLFMGAYTPPRPKMIRLDSGLAPPPITEPLVNLTPRDFNDASESVFQEATGSVAPLVGSQPKAGGLSGTRTGTVISGPAVKDPITLGGSPGVGGPRLSGISFGTMKLAVGTALDTKMTLHGLGGQAVHDVGGGIDRITYEILQRLDKQKLTLVWLMDASGSLKEKRQQVAERLGKVYRELGQTGKTKDRALLSGVVAFGKRHEFLTPKPTDDVERVKDLMSHIKDDPTGVENTFAAVLATLKRWGRETVVARRGLMLIVVTDEMGDDEQYLEPGIKLGRQLKATVYVMGAAAPFGKRIVPFPYTLNGRTYDLPMDRGPESAMLEMIDLPFYYEGPQYKLMESGFGPWALSRLTRETHGIFFQMEDVAAPIGGPKFDLDIMRDYEPDYGPRRQYMTLLGKNPLRAAVVNAAEVSHELSDQVKIVTPRMVFQANDETQLRQNLEQGQQDAANELYVVGTLLGPIQAAEKHRAKEKSKRWAAAYDLILGRLLANKVRAYEYNWACAQMKVAPKKFKNPDHNAWRLSPDPEVHFSAKAKAAAVLAQKYLRRVIKENPDTPWAILAARELQNEMGFKWQETNGPRGGRAAEAKAAKEMRLRPKKRPSQPAGPPPKLPKV